MDEPILKSGQWPNIAIDPRTGRHAATGEKIERGGRMTDKPISGTETSESARLLPCPFCGGEAHTYRNNLWHVGCEHAHNGCVTMSAFATEAEAIDAWNTRATLGSGTCHIEAFDDGVDEALDGEWFSYAPPTWYLSCGHEAQGLERPNFCPNCGAKVVD